MAKGLIAEGWEQFREQVVPPNASSVQVDETQKAFYAGASFLLSQVMLRLDPGNDPTDEDLAMLDGIHEELVAFARSQRG
jgi:hypothetical protein